MITIQGFENFPGFGNGEKIRVGEYLHSQGMNESPNGLITGWNVAASIDSDTLSGLTTPNWFAQATHSTQMYVYSVDALGVIYRSTDGVGTWAQAYTPGQTAKGNGLIGDQVCRLLYAQARYLGKHDGTADYTTGTIAVTNGSANVVGTGTTFTSGMVNKRIVIGGVWYTIATFTDATHIALATNYAGATDSGLSYAMKVGWDDLFKDFGASSLPSDTDFRPSDTYEDWVAFGNGNKIALLNVTDDSFNAAGFTLPSKFLVRAIKSGRNGILVGANIGNRCILFLWDAFSDRSIAPWIWLKGNIQSIAVDEESGEWIVVTNRKVLRTNGYTTAALAPVPDSQTNQAYLNVIPQGTEVINDFLIVANTVALTNRIRAGLWILNLKTGLWEYAPVSNGATYNVTVRCVFFDSSFRTHFGWSIAGAVIRYYLGYVLNTVAPTKAYVITGLLGKGKNQKIAEGAKLNLGISPYLTSSDPITFNVAVKVYNFKRPLWTYAQQKTVATLYDRITVDGTIASRNNAEVGDEITIMEGTNAGQTAHITSITGKNTSTEVWLLDTTLTGYTEESAFIQVMPFKLMKKHTITSATELKELYFNCKNKIKGQKFLLKILLDNIGSVPIELIEGDFIYDDLGPFTTK